MLQFCRLPKQLYIGYRYMKMTNVSVRNIEFCHFLNVSGTHDAAQFSYTRPSETKEVPQRRFFLFALCPQKGRFALCNCLCFRGCRPSVGYMGRENLHHTDLPAGRCDVCCVIFQTPIFQEVNSTASLMLRWLCTVRKVRAKAPAWRASQGEEENIGIA